MAPRYNPAETLQAKAEEPKEEEHTEQPAKKRAPQRPRRAELSLPAGESVGVILEELIGSVPHMAWADSQSGLAILVNKGQGGSRHTRHLRTRAAYARQAVQDISNLPGDVMLADTGTKALAAARLEDLKKRMNMRSMEDVKESGEEEEEEMQGGKDGKKSDEEGQEKEETSQKMHKAATVLRLLTLAATISAVKGQGEESGEDEDDVHIGWMVFFYTLMVIMLTSVIWYLKEGVVGCAQRSPDRKSRLKSMKKGKEDESEEEVPRPTYLPTPTQSPLPPTPHPTLKECQLPL